MYLSNCLILHLFIWNNIRSEAYVNFSNTIDTTVEVEKTKTTYKNDHVKKLYFKSKQGVVTQCTQPLFIKTKIHVLFGLIS